MASRAVGKANDRNTGYQKWQVCDGDLECMISVLLTGCSSIHDTNPLWMYLEKKALCYSNFLSSSGQRLAIPAEVGVFGVLVCRGVADRTMA